MPDPKLSILIPVHEKHIPKYLELLKSLELQIAEFSEGEIEVIKLTNNGSKSIGEYRQDLLLSAKGQYVVFIDADDKISIEYTALIMAALESNPDCVGICGTMTTNGKNRATWEISKNLPYRTTKRNGLVHYERFTNHLAPIKREIALQVGYLPLKFQEDYQYALALHNRKLCKTEVKIPKRIYHYDYQTAK